jgi:hypothetical protein
MAESLLAQALGLFELGQDADAVDLLKQILEIDPTSESAMRARLMLRQREVLSMKRAWRLDAYVGYEWDSNVLLESATNESIGTGRSDSRGRPLEHGEHLNRRSFIKRQHAEHSGISDCTFVN